MKQAAKDIKDGVVEGVKDGIASQIYDRACKAYHGLEKSIEDRFFSNRKFDIEKARLELENDAKAVLNYGEKALKSIRESIAQGVSGIKEDYRSWVPGKEEI